MCLRFKKKWGRRGSFVSRSNLLVCIEGNFFYDQAKVLGPGIEPRPYQKMYGIDGKLDDRKINGILIKTLVRNITRSNILTGVNILITICLE